ncbi:hypothetical protein DFH28DRAFT_888068, partial [Melampsora americana]
LLLGSGRHLLSEKQYEKCCQVFKLFNISLPVYRTLGRLRQKMCPRLGLNVVNWDSPLKKPCYSLSIKEIVAQELANPVVTEHLVTIPEYDPNLPIDRLSQSRKWREGFPRNQRVQMVPSSKGNFFLYEPVCNSSGDWVVPIFFYQQSGDYYAKCLKASISSNQMNSSRSSKFSIIVDSDQPFDSPLLTNVRIDSLRETFINSKGDDGLPLESQYGGVMYREYIPLPNPWRLKANGKIIQHVPITLYSDDTSGNVSKKWNKHMSFYFTLSGLPPGMSNQEYNIHFLATSNKAGALELGDKIVDELNTLGTEGFITYDESIKKEVLVMVVPLCHLGDSPMHAEITNTTNPSVTLNPCRICKLSVETLGAKQDPRYTRAFVGIDQDEEATQPRDWNSTKLQTYTLWELLCNPKKYTEFRKKSKEFGIKDTLNGAFVEQVHELHQDPAYTKEEVQSIFDNLNQDFGERLFNPFLRLKGFEGHRDTPVETLHVILLGVVKYLFRDAMDNMPASCLPSILARWKSFDTSGLSIPPIQPKTMTQFYQSLVGKDFRTILQTVPFVLYPHISEERRRMWTALAHLGSLIFQTRIINIPSYLDNFKKLVKIFLGHIIRWSAQWTNKPKFHMLVHLVECIDRFGPLCLCATEKFESFNGVTRIASVHSSRHEPGLHIATTFNNSRLMRLIFSGSSFWDNKYSCRARAGKEVIALFSKNKWLRKSCGFNKSWNMEGKIFMKGQRNNNPGVVPAELSTEFPRHSWSSKTQASLQTKQRICLKNFVLFEIESNNLSPQVGRIEAFWQGESQGSAKYLAKLKVCSLDENVDEFYGFQGLSVSQEALWIPIQRIKCVLNIQHNCHLAQCQPLSSPARRDGQLPVKSPFQIHHKELNKYVLNSGALYSAEEHRLVANITHIEWTENDWTESIKMGMSNWRLNQEKKEIAKTEKAARETIKRDKAKGKKRLRNDDHIDPALS